MYLTLLCAGCLLRIKALILLWIDIINIASHLASQYWLNLSPFVGADISCNDTQTIL